MGLVGRIAAAAGVVEETQHAFVAAIRDFVQDRPVAAFGVARLQQEELGRELNFAVVIARSQVDVCDDAVGVVARINGEEDPAGEPLVRTRQPERLAVENCFFSLDFDSDNTAKHAREGNRGEERNDQEPKHAPIT